MLHYDGCTNGPLLRDIRKQRNLTIDKVCEITGISASTLKQIEQGGRNLSMRTLYILMEVYEVDANTMLSIRTRRNQASIDERLKQLPVKQREYFTKTFLYMLDQAEKVA